MKNHEIYFKKSVQSYSTPIGDQSILFLNRYSSELKYIVPWAQYEKSLGGGETKNNVSNQVQGMNKNTNRDKNIGIM